MLSAYLSGFGITVGLIMAIGAQNAFVLVQAIRREHHFIVAAVCALLDIVLIGAGVLGLGALVASHQTLRLLVGTGGAVFLFWFGYKALRQAFSGQSMLVNAGTGQRHSLKKTMLTLLGVSLLNPHVYLDTVIMLGAISGNYPGIGRYLFGLGAMTASTCWFFALTFCGTLLAPAFARPKAWQILYLIVCVMVWLVGVGLVVDVWNVLHVAGQR